MKLVIVIALTVCGSIFMLLDQKAIALSFLGVSVSVSTNVLILYLGASKSLKRQIAELQSLKKEGGTHVNP